ncbi:LysR family transcriptional regulator [Streptosporangium sp. NBC_01495]|uniref:LysR family transcriptional regulator n=1 Tax=Streptosporangium sp. NBC_01495 TaxID=2903899 RepID=UPI002E38009C|nr:LysR family transcriptional regulator [Streptosporangium sp. NBC_01495]
MLNPTHLRTLETVCRTGSFAVAARELGYTASGVSQQMAALERACGLVLFEREVHGIRPTAAADQLVERTGRVLAVLGEFEDEVRDLAAGRVGRLRLGSFPTASVRLVPAALAALATDHPAAEILLEEGEPRELAPMLVNGELDAALLYEYGHVPQRWPEDLVMVPLLHEALLLLTRRRRPADTGEATARLPAMRTENWIASREGTDGAISLERLCATAGFAPAITRRSNNYDVVRQLVGAGLGVAVVPALGHIPDERVHAQAVDSAPAHRRVLMAYRRANVNPLLQPALRAIRAAVPRNRPWLAPPQG